METTEFIIYLREHKNPNKADGMENYMRNQFSFLGIQSVERRNLSNDYLKTLRKEVRLTFSEETSNMSVVNWDAVFYLWEQAEREFPYVAMDYLKAVKKYLVLSDLDHLTELVLEKPWWDTIDNLAKIIGALAHKENIQAETMREWSISNNLWIRRVAILHQLDLKTHTDSVLLAQIILNNIHSEEFFIQKAIGWALREYAKTNEKWVANFVSKYKTDLCRLSYREATKNISLV